MYTPKPELMQQISINFIYHSPKSNQPERYERIRNFGRDLAMIIACNCPPSREQSLAITKLEECVMWANASIARNETWPDPTASKT